jgi:hypothetical protein
MVQSHLEEPGAGIPHAGICAGAWGQPLVYCDYGLKKNANQKPKNIKKSAKSCEYLLNRFKS